MFFLLCFEHLDPISKVVRKAASSPEHPSNLFEIQPQQDYGHMFPVTGNVTIIYEKLSLLPSVLGRLAWESAQSGKATNIECSCKQKPSILGLI